MNTMARIRYLEEATLEERKDALLALSPSDAVVAALWALAVADSYREAGKRADERIRALNQYIKTLEEEIRTNLIQQRIAKGKR